MTDKITITKKQFMKWSASETPEADWNDLVFESRKPELIERWATVNEQGVVVGTYMFEDQAKRDALDYYRVILLREVGGGE